MAVRAPTAILALIILLAGCAGAPPTTRPASAAAPTAGPGTFSESTGALEGTVTSEESDPIAHAEVALLETTVQTVTDEEGRFSFSGLEAGTYRLGAAALGYEASYVHVEIRVQELTKTIVVLQAIEIVEPYHETASQVGQIVCDMAWNTTSPGFFRPCVLIDGAGGASLMFSARKNWDATWSWLSETRWRATTATSAPQLVNHYDISVQGASGGQEVIGEKHGGSPLIVSIDRAEAEDKLPCPDDAKDCGLFFQYWSYTDLTPAITLHQSFETWLTTFCNAPMPAGFSALPDS